VNLEPSTGLSEKLAWVYEGDENYIDISALLSTQSVALTPTFVENSSTFSSGSASVGSSTFTSYNGADAVDTADFDKNNWMTDGSDQCFYDSLVSTQMLACPLYDEANETCETTDNVNMNAYLAEAGTAPQDAVFPGSSVVCSGGIMTMEMFDKTVPRFVGGVSKYGT
jgi:hypothetical protein